MKTKKRIVFFYDSAELAGAEMQIINIANYFIKNGHNVFLYDNERGIISSRCPGIEVRRFGEYLEFCDVLIYFASHIIEIGKKINIIGLIEKEIIWNVHPDNIFSLFPLILKFRNIIDKRLIKVLTLLIYPVRYFKVLYKIKGCTILYMNGINYHSFKLLFDTPKDSFYLPICASLSTANLKFRRMEKDNVRIIFLGRLVGFKVKPLITLVRLLGNLSNYKFNIKIVGSGLFEKNLKDLHFSNITFNFLGNLYDDDLDKEVEECDMAFSMGTAALDLALKKIPVLLSPINASLNKYCWLYETTNFDLLVTEETAIMEIEEVLVQLKMNREFIVDMNYNYVLSNHSVESVARSILNEEYT